MASAAAAERSALKASESARIIVDHAREDHADAEAQLARADAAEADAQARYRRAVSKAQDRTRGSRGQ
jgi:hypothetical protein